MYSFPFVARQHIPTDLVRLQLEMDLARQVQLSLLPKSPPSIPGVDLSCFFQPALDVGGDFFDFIAGPDGSLTFLVGDVSGKGMPSAMLMTMTLGILRAEANFQEAPTPESILRYANAKLLEDFDRVGMFATVFVGQYHPASQELIFANAGHSPVIFQPADGRPRLLEADGTPLGIQEKSFSKNHRIRLGENDLLVATTDGLYEAHNPSSKRFGLHGLFKLLRGLNSKSSAEISDTLAQTVRQFRDCWPQADDQTVLVLRCTGR